MATGKKTSTKKVLDKDKLISMYMDDVLENEKRPKTVYKFCKEHKIKEEDFYNFYGSFDGLQQGIWVKFYEHTLTLIKKSPEFENFSNREKLLTFY